MLVTTTSGHGVTAINVSMNSSGLTYKWSFVTGTSNSLVPEE